MRYLLLFAYLLQLTACFPGRPLGYFEVDPYTRNLNTYQDEAITIVVDPTILEAHLVDKSPNKYRHFTQFRTTLLNNWQRALRPHFRTVGTADVPPSEGYTLYVHRMHPRYEAEVISTGGDGATDLVAAVFDYDVELAYAGKTLRNARGRAKGTRKMITGSGWEDAMISAFEYALEEAFAELFVEGELSAD